MVIIIVVACLVNVISIVLVSRYLCWRWKSIMAEQEDAENSITAAQQDKELSIMEAQLQRSTPVVVLQPDSRVSHTAQTASCRMFTARASVIHPGVIPWHCSSTAG